MFDIGGGTFLDLSAIATSAASGGADEESVEQVKNTAPKLFAANKRAVSRSDYIGHILSFTGSNSASAWGEFEEATQKGFADLTMMNRAYVTAIPVTLTDNSEVISNEDGTNLTVTGTGTGTIVPGSVTITSDTATWYDYDGKGLLMSPDIVNNRAFGGTATASDNPGFADNAWDSNEFSDWNSLTVPTVFNPIRVAYNFSGSENVKSIRLRSTTDPVLNDRGFPKQIIILGSNLASPDVSNRDDWTVIRGVVTLDEPGYSAFSRWIPVNDPSNSVAYDHIAVEILEAHGSGVAKLSDIQVQSAVNDSTIDYDTGDVTLVYGFGEEPTGDVTMTSVIGNFSSTQKTDLLTYLDDLNHFTTLLEFRDSVAKTIEINASVYYLPGFEPNTVLSNVQAALTNLFTISENSINKPVYLSDIYQAIQDVEGVDYSIISNPVADTFTEIDQFVYLTNQVISIFPTDR